MVPRSAALPNAVNERQVTVLEPLPVSSNAKDYLQPILRLKGTDKSTAVAIAAALLGDPDQAFRCLLFSCPRETPSVPLPNLLSRLPLPAWCSATSKPCGARARYSMHSSIASCAQQKKP